MNTEIHNDTLTLAVHKALLLFMISNGYIHPFKVLGEICCVGERTIEHRFTAGGWSGDEIRMMSKVFGEEFKIEATNALFNN